MPTLTDINALAADAFVQLLGGVFEHSPWVAEQAYAQRPFASPQALHAALVEQVERASAQRQLALMRAHPELAGTEAAAGTLSAASKSEQAGAGLGALSCAQRERIGALNRAYRARFGFPFIIAVRDHTSEGVLAALERRLAADPAGERAASLRAIYRIAELRLARLID